MNSRELKSFLDRKVREYNNPDFIEFDPVSIPHLFKSKQDIEISGLWSAILSWGQRKTIIKKSKELMTLMDNRPHEFIMNHSEKDLKALKTFKHRTFNYTDTLYFISFFKWYYTRHKSLEKMFSVSIGDATLEKGLIKFHSVFCSLPHFPGRTGKHVSTPLKNSACKRINMFLRWMVRKDTNGVDFGIWKKISPRQLVCPCDIHVEKVARKLGLVTRTKADWKMALELTGKLRNFDADDPVKYDFALFGLGVEEKFWH